MGLDDDIDKLAGIPAFAAMEPEALRVMAFSADRLALRAGDVLFRRDEVSDAGFAVLSGSVAVDASGHGATARIVRPPALIGERALLIETRHPAAAIAREPTVALKIPRQLFHRVLSEFPQSAERLRQALSRDLRQFVGALAAVRKGLMPEDEAPGE